MRPRLPSAGRPLPYVGRLCLSALLVGITELAGGELPVAAAQGGTPGTARPNVVEIVSRGLQFDAPDTIPAGWTTFRFRNETTGTHFVILERMPVFDGEQKTLEDSKAQVVPVFQNLMDSIAGVPPRFPRAGLALPPWYGRVVLTGGPGLVAPGRTAETSVRLTPGTYVIECYVKDNGVFHSVAGMIDQIVVAAETSGAPAPVPSMRVTVSSAKGIEMDGRLSSGRNTLAVHFADQVGYSHFLGHDIHLARMEEDTDLDSLADWMNWSVPGELETPAPAKFLGGVQDMPAGSTAYFDVHLTPGRYALIAEVPDPGAKHMLRMVVVEMGSTQEG